MNLGRWIIYIDLPSFSQQSIHTCAHRCTWIQSSNANHFGGFHLSNSTSRSCQEHICILNLARTCIVLLLRRSLRASWGGSSYWASGLWKEPTYERQNNPMLRNGALVRVQQELVLIVRRWNEKRRARTEAQRPTDGREIAVYRSKLLQKSEPLNGF